MALPSRKRKMRQGGAVIFAEATIDIASALTDVIDVTNDVTIGGAEVGDLVVVNWDNEAAAIDVSAYVSAKNIVTVKAMNSTAGTVNAASATFYFMVFKRK